MSTPLMRNALRPRYGSAWKQGSAHPGLLIQRGLEERDDEDVEAKTAQVERLCATSPGPVYRRAYDRWVSATASDLRFRCIALRLQTRLFIGLGGGGMLETGCAIGHGHGAPYIPGSAVKGVARAHAETTPFGAAHRRVLTELFGTEPDDDNPAGLSGLVTFHDAWWIPGSAPKPQPDRPLVQEVVTTHHSGYYRSEGREPATDFDSPIPNAQIAVHGSFLFVLEGDPGWTGLAERLLTAALTVEGIGAKTRAGYGYFACDTVQTDALRRQRDAAEKRLTDLAAAREKARALAAAEAELEAADPERRLLILTERAIAAFLQQDSLSQRDQRGTLVGTLNDLAETARAWGRSDDREAAAALLEQAFEQIGWADPGKKAAQRVKQGAKRRAMIAALRRGDRPLE